MNYEQLMVLAYINFPGTDRRNKELRMAYEWWISEVKHEMFMYDWMYDAALYVKGFR